MVLLFAEIAIENIETPISGTPAWLSLSRILPVIFDDVMCKGSICSVRDQKMSVLYLAGHKPLQNPV